MILNIGLDCPDGSYNHPRRVHQALRACGIAYDAMYWARPRGREDTAIVELPDDAADYFRLHILANALGQDCIAAWHEGQARGLLIGHKAGAWGPFDPALFLTPDGQPLAA